MLKSHLSIKHDDEEETKHVEEEEVVEREVVPVEIKHLTRSQVSCRLSLLGRTAEGHGYTYLKARITDMGLTHIDAIKSFKQLQFVDVSSNRLEINELQVVTELPYLVLLHADKNRLNSAALKKMKYFQVLIMNNNQIDTVQDIFQPEMSTIELGFNKIQKIQFDNRMPEMKVLDFRNNMISSIAGIDFPKLDSLYLANNKITSLVGLERLVSLRILHVRHNPLKVLDGFHPNLTKLSYVNLRCCRISTLRQVKKLRVLKGLETLVMKGCPYMGGTGEEDPETADAEDDPEIRIEILATLPRLKRINKGAITPDERTEAKALMVQWIEEGEKDEEEMEFEDQREEEEEDSPEEI